MSNPGQRTACGPAEGFVRHSLGFAVVGAAYTLTTSLYFDNFKFAVFDAGGPQCRFIRSVLRAARFSYVH